MAGERYTAQYDAFNGKFNLNFDIKRDFEIHSRFGALDDFTLSSSPQRRIQNAYLKTLNNALQIYLEEKTKMQDGKTYDMSDVSIKDFVNEFDKVMEAICTDAAPEGEPYQYPRFAGLPENVTVARAWKEAKQFNQPLSGIWGDQIREGTLTLDNLKSMTNRSAGMLDNMVTSNTKYSDEAKTNLVNVVMAKNTMEAAINKRSWTSWLNPLNWGPNRRENAYLKELEGKIETYKTAGFPVDNVVPEEYTKNMLGKALGELQKAYGTRNQPTQNTQTAAKTEDKSKDKKAVKEAKNTKKKSQPQKAKDVVGKVPTHEVAKELMKDEDAFSKQIFNVIGNYGDKFMRGVSTASTVSGVKTRINKAWQEFNGADTEEERKEAAQNIALTTFRTFYNTAVANISAYNNTAVDRIVMTQKLTDFVLNNFSPIASNSKYAEYGNNYFVKNATPEEFFKNAMAGGMYKGDVNDAKKDLDNAKFELGVGKMSVNTEKDFKEKSSQKAEKIKEHNVPTKNLGKDK